MEEVHSYLKMKTAMNAVLAANKFKAMQGNKKKKSNDDNAAPETVS